MNWNGPATLNGGEGKTVENHTLPKLRGYSNLTGKIKDEQDAINSVGGEIFYTDDITFSSSSLLNKYGNLYSQEHNAFISKIANNSFEFISNKIDDLKKLKVLIINIMKTLLLKQ